MPNRPNPGPLDGPPLRLMEQLGNGEVLELDSELGRAVLEFDARPEFRHSGGVVQGGFVTGWIDSAMAHAAAAKSQFTKAPATLELKISFLEPVQPGQRVRAEGWVVREGRTVVFLEGKLVSADGRLLATGSSTGRWLERSRRTPVD